MKKVRHPKPETGDEFERIAADAAPNLLAEFWDFVRHNKKWWLVPIFISLLAAGALLFIASTGIVPFIYPFF